MLVFVYVGVSRIIGCILEYVVVVFACVDVPLVDVYCSICGSILSLCMLVYVGLCHIWLCECWGGNVCACARVGVLEIYYVWLCVP